MKTIFFSLLAILSVFCTPVAAAEPAKVESFGKIGSASWLVGRWQSAAGERATSEEHWSAPAGGAMVGMFRLLSGDRPGVYELLLLEEEADGVWMRMRHFRPQMVPQEEEPIKLKLASAATDKLVFENPSGDKPKRVTYALAGDELTVTVETMRDGRPVSFSLKMQRAK